MRSLLCHTDLVFERIYLSLKAIFTGTSTSKLGNLFLEVDGSAWLPGREGYLVVFR